MPLNGKTSVKIGLIFYYLSELRLDDYDLDYRYRRDFTQGTTFYLFVALAVLSLLAEVIFGTNRITCLNAEKTMRLRKSSLACMSEMYKIIYIINLSTGEMTPVSAGEVTEQSRKNSRS